MRKNEENPIKNLDFFKTSRHQVRKPTILTAWDERVLKNTYRFLSKKSKSIERAADKIVAFCLKSQGGN